MTLKRSTTMAVGLFLLVVARAASADTAPVDRFTGLPLPLLAGERLAPLKDGCHVIVDAGRPPADDAIFAQKRWLGACRFGLVHGQGVLIGTDGKRPDSLIEPRYGKFPRWVSDSGRETFPANPTSAATWEIEIHDSVEEARAAGRRGLGGMLPDSARGGLDFFTTLAYIAQIRSGGSEFLTVTAYYSPCPLAGKRVDSAAELSKLGFSAEDTRALAPYCDAAYQRLKREVGASDDAYLPWGSEPFLQRADGNYYSIEVARQNAQTTPAGEWERKRMVCPQPGEAKSCDPLWRPLVAPYIAIRDAERQRMAEQERARDAMAQALEAAFAAKVARLRASTRGSQQ